MKISKSVALRLWDDVFGADNKIVLDCYGTYIFRDDYGDHETMRDWKDGKKHSFGWDLDHIRPVSSFENESEADFMNNLEPIHFENNREKADRYPSFVIGDESYTVVRCDICGANGERGYGIKNKDGVRVDWKAVSGHYYKTSK